MNNPLKKNPSIVLRVEEDTILSSFISFLKQEDELISRETFQYLCDGKHNEATIAAGRKFQLDRVFELLQEVIEEHQQKND